MLLAKFYQPNFSGKTKVLLTKNQVAKILQQKTNTYSSYMNMDLTCLL